MSQAEDPKAKKEPAKPAEKAVDSTTAPKADPKKTHVSVTYKHNSPLMKCRFDPTGRYVFATAEDMTIQRWDLKSGAKVAYAGHDSWVYGLAFTADGKTMVTGGCDGQLIWWPVEGDKPAPIRKVPAHDGWIRQIAISGDGKFLASAGNDHVVKLWNVADGKLVRELKGHDCHVYSVMFHPDGKFVLSGDLKGKVHQFEIATGKLVRTFEAKALHSYNKGQGIDYGGVRALAITPDGKYLACGGLHKASNPLGAVNEPLVMLFEWESQKLAKSQVAAGVKGVVWRALYHADGYLAAASGGSGGGYLIFWKPDAVKEIHKLKLPDTARDMDLHNDGLRLATAHYNRSLIISSMTPKPPAPKPKPKK